MAHGKRLNATLCVVALLILSGQTPEVESAGLQLTEQIDSRLATAAREMEHWHDYRYTVISGSVEEDLQRFRQIMEAESYLSRRLVQK